MAWRQKTAEGKTRAARTACKGGNRAVIRRLARMLREQNTQIVEHQDCRG